MAIFEDVVLTDSIEIKTTPEKIFDFITHIIDDETYRAWHPEDHIAFHWIKGKPWQEGSVIYAEEYIHGKLHRIKFIISRIIPNRLIEYAPLSRILRIYFPKNTFSMEPKGDTCLFTASGTLRVGRLAKFFAKGKLDAALASARRHMKEEGENMKSLLESEGGKT